MEKITLIYDKRMSDYVVRYPNSYDGGFVMSHLISDALKYRLPSEEKPSPFNFENENFIQELEKRGYDPKTIKFSIELKK